MKGVRWLGLTEVSMNDIDKQTPLLLLLLYKREWPCAKKFLIVLKGEKTRRKKKTHGCKGIWRGRFMCMMVGKVGMNGIWSGRFICMMVGRYEWYTKQQNNYYIKMYNVLTHVSLL